MLKQILLNTFSSLFSARRNNNPIVIVCATRLTEENFWTSSLMGHSIRSLKDGCPRLRWKISFENAKGLPSVYNRAIEDAIGNEILIFVHDDVWLDPYQLADSVDSGLTTYQLIGPAGSKRIVKGQISWAFKGLDGSSPIWDWNYLSGAIWHGQPAKAELTQFGPYPSTCELLDGVFLAARAATIQKANLRFDEQFDFHFYDLDFSRSARSAGLKIGTWPLALTHDSKGNFGGSTWQKNFAQYSNKWDAANSANQVSAGDSLK
ncbi:hypothetical protein GN316_09155 [Xylophilus sp. Kf1]|nr:hypothetical protein [Xylophilus sp. Kf1]